MSTLIHIHCHNSLDAMVKSPSMKRKNHEENFLLIEIVGLSAFDGGAQIIWKYSLMNTIISIVAVSKCHNGYNYISSQFLFNKLKF